MEGARDPFRRPDLADGHGRADRRARAGRRSGREELWARSTRTPSPPGQRWRAATCSPDGPPKRSRCSRRTFWPARMCSVPITRTRCNPAMILPSATARRAARPSRGPLHERNLSIQERLLGADHPGTLVTRSNLASALLGGGPHQRGAGRVPAGLWPTRNGCWAPSTPTACIPAATWPAPTGPTGGYPSRSPCTTRTWPSGSGPWARTIRTPSPRGMVWREPSPPAGRLVDAVPLLRQSGRRPRTSPRRRPPGHPGVPDGLAAVYSSAGWFPTPSRFTRAQSPTPSGCSGPNHPDTLAFRNDLAAAYHRAGRPGEAIELLEPTLAEPRALARPGTSGHARVPQRPGRRVRQDRAAGRRDHDCTSATWPTSSGCWGPITRPP